MAVYVGEPVKKRMVGGKEIKVCTMVADTTAELMEVADRIGINRIHVLGLGSYKERFELSTHKAIMAAEIGAKRRTEDAIAEIVKQKWESRKLVKP